ncbi:Vegetative incompatibility protein HET-E-1 [Ceratocystis lukuohia]|uniref:Vegetative incompatibility protein HET-E-1 n=1 Tax=Ceratocystis lukuohia TaxID=2019550 RepID=A0ABR4MPZ5_9PEZI
MKEVVEWTTLNGLEIDQGKPTLLHIKGRRRIAGNPFVTVEGLGTYEPIPAKESMRWLGLHLDSSLLFNKNIAQVIVSVNRLANGLRYLAGCHKGTNTKSMLTAVRACALSKALFVASTWSGLETTKETAEKLNISVRKRLRAALPMYRTAPRECLHHAAGVPPFELLLEDGKRREAIRRHTLDDRHILRGPNFNPVVERLCKLLPAQMDKHTRLGPLLEGPDETRRILKAWADKTPGRLARVLWVPGHMGTKGNELADAQAKLGCQGLATEHRFSLAGAWRWRRDRLRLAYKGWWK